MRVRVTFEYEPDEDKVDADHDMGVTEEEYDNVTEVLIGRFGAEDVEVEKVSA